MKKKVYFGILGITIIALSAATALNASDSILLPQTSSLFLDEVDALAYETSEVYHEKSEWRTCIASCKMYNSKIDGEKYDCEWIGKGGRKWCIISECVRKGAL